MSSTCWPFQGMEPFRATPIPLPAEAGSPSEVFMGLSDLLEGSLSYDQITRFLSQQRFDSKTLWQLVKPDEACCAFCVKTRGGAGNSGGIQRS